MIISGPLLAIDAHGANLRLTLGLGLLVAVPTVIISGPLLAIPLTRWVKLDPPTTVLGMSDDAVGGNGAGGTGGASSSHGAGKATATATATETGTTTLRKPSFGISVLVVLLPVILMLARSVVEIAGATGTGYGTCLLYTSPSPRDGLLSRMPSSA